MNAKTLKQKKREQKYSSRPTGNFSVVAPFFFLLLSPATAKNAWGVIWVIIKDFFFLQLNQKFHFTKIPVIYVDTEIDDKIPFSPSHASDYMGFVEYFIRPFSMLKKRLGYKKAIPYINLYLKLIQKIYSNAALIYRFCMTTTRRPKYYKSKKFRAIHFFDPHLLCVPSIHVSIAAGLYAWFAQLYKTGILPEDEAARRLKEAKDQAVRIVESVLFVKQHSVNCVPLALYMMTSTMNKSFFTPKEACDFIDSLFVETDEISKEDKKLINEHFHYMYERALLENCYSSNWQECIRHWLVDYARETNQNLPFI